MSQPTFVLVHGAWHSGQCWSAVASRLSAGGFTVLTPDLPGHGNNPLPLAKVTLKAYVRSILELLDSIAGPVLLIGHSMAGIVISEVAARAPGKIAGLIYVCAYLPRHGESVFDLIALNRSHEPFTAIELAMQVSDDKRSCTIAGDDIIALFYPLAAPALAEAAKASFGSQAVLPLAARVNLDSPGFEQIPRTYISCTKDRVIPLHHQRRMLNRQACATLLQMDADHSPFLSCPEALADLLAASSVHLP